MNTYTVKFKEGGYTELKGDTILEALMCLSDYGITTVKSIELKQ